MNVTQEVILDLLPLYVSGEASPASRALVEEYLIGDAELARRIRLQCAENFVAAVPSSLPPALELRSLRRARKLLALQRWLLGFAIGFSAVALSNQISTDEGHITQFHFLLMDHPLVLGIDLALGLLCWMAYFLIRRRLRTA